MNRELFYPAQVHRIPAGSRNVFVVNSNDENTIVMTPLELRLFDLLAGCLPLHQHASRLLESDVPGMNRQWAEKLVRDWMANGLLRPFTLVQPTLQHNGPANGSGVQRRSIPESTIGGLLSLILDRTSSLGVPENVVRFALESSGADTTGGTERNVAILRSDNGTVSFPPPGGILRAMQTGTNPPEGSLPDRDMIALTDPSGYPEMLLQDRQSLENSAPTFPEGELAAVSQRFLGTSVLEHFDRLDFENAPSDLLRAMERFNPRIRWICTGVFGDRALSMPYAWLYSHTRIQPDFLQDPDAYGEIRESTARILHPEQIAISGTCPTTGAIAAIHLEEESFPFFPLSPPDTSQSLGITEALFRTRYPTDAVLTVPAAVHQTAADVTNGVIDFSSYFDRVDTRVMLVTRHIAARLLHRSGPARLRELASRLQRFSSLPSDQMEQYYVKLKRQYCATLIRRLTRLTDQHELSALLVEDSRHAISLLEAERDSPPGDHRSVLEYNRNVLRLWGELLHWWPTILKAARENSHEDVCTP